jgi:trehalose 2-sulfotransferase
MELLYRLGFTSFSARSPALEILSIVDSLAAHFGRAVGRSCLICSVQRADSRLLSHALQDTGVLAIPAEYFHSGVEEFWRSRWGVTSEDAFLQAPRQEPATANGVCGSKMMRNYFADTLARLRAWLRPRLAPDASDPDVLAAAFPGMRYIWLRRADKLRQAISWPRADATGQYSLAQGAEPAPPPPFDREAISRLARYAQQCESGGREWFAIHSITPARSCTST